MNHTKKMVVVPQDVMENLRFNQQQKVGPVGKQMMAVDKDLREIFDRDDLAMDEKLTLYYEVLNKYKKLNEAYTKQTAPQKVPEPSKVVEPSMIVPPSVKDEWLDKIDKQFNVRNHEKAEQLYNWIKEKSDIDWDEKGEISGIPKSNILTLLDEVTRPTPRHKDIEPTGLPQFVTRLRQSNPPEYLIGNTSYYKKYYTAPEPVERTPVKDYPPATPDTPKRPHRLESPHAIPVPTPKTEGNITVKQKGEGMRWLTMEDI